ncbi:MAG: SGNH/GDSL hydrolase family protein [Lachnospiraceae bacterium]
MKKILSFLILVCIFLSSVTLEQPEYVSASVPPTVYILSDSTAADYSSYMKSTLMRGGWGSYLSSYLTDQINVRNLAKEGASARSYIRTSQYQEFLQSVQAGDYVLIQFGHNDTLQNYRERVSYTGLDPSALDENGYDSTTRKYSYEWYLYEKYIKVTQDAGACPILVTPPAKIQVTKTPTYSGLSQYRSAMIKMASKYNIPLIDLGSLSKNGLKKIAHQSSDQTLLSYFALRKSGNVDYVHFSAKGANYIASLISGAADKLSGCGFGLYVKSATASFSSSTYKCNKKGSKSTFLKILMNPVLLAESGTGDCIITYKSSNKKIFTVSGNGKIKGVDSGTAFLTAIVLIGSMQYVVYTKVKIRS